MTTWNEVERLRLEAVETGRYSIHMSIVLALILSLALIGIISKNDLTNYFWVGVAAFALPMPVALFFKNRIAQLGGFQYVTALLVALGAAAAFGI
jgi:hypothetical protein